MLIVILTSMKLVFIDSSSRFCCNALFWQPTHSQRDQHEKKFLQQNVDIIAHLMTVRVKPFEYEGRVPDVNKNTQRIFSHSVSVQVVKRKKKFVIKIIVLKIVWIIWEIVQKLIGRSGINRFKWLKSDIKMFSQFPFDYCYSIQINDKLEFYS